jgi:hypothetical protein
MTKTLPQDPKQWTEYPTKKGIYSIRIDSLEASTKFEGKWVAQASVEHLGNLKLWMSHKQAGSLHRNLDAPELWAVIDTGNSEKPRFVWASNNREWLEGAFLKDSPKETKAPVAAPKAASKPTYVKATKPAYNPPPNRFETGDEELPF